MVKKIKVTSPNEMVDITKDTVETLIGKFETKLKKEDKDEEYYHLVIYGEYNRKVYDEIERIYSDAGWGQVKCKSSSENNEKPGLTDLQLWKTKPQIL